MPLISKPFQPVPEPPTPMTIEQPRPPANTVAQMNHQACIAAVEYQADVKAAAAEHYGVDIHGNEVGTLTKQGYLDRVASVRNSDAARLLDLAEDADARRVTEARERYAAVMASKRTEGDIAEELRRSRYAERVHRHLDAAEGEGVKTAVAVKLVEDASPSELSVLLEELPTRLDNTAWLPEKLKQVDPELADAAMELRKAEQCHAISQYQIGAVRRGFDSGVPLPRAVLDRLAPAVARVDPDAAGE
jgi:hypothetical protein